MSWIAARRYARALIALGVENGEYRRYAEELASVLELMKKAPILKSTLLNPSFSSRARREVLEQTLGGRGLSPQIINLLSLLVERNRLQEMEKIIEYYRDAIDEVEGRVKAWVRSASPMHDGEVTQVKAALGNALGKEIVLEREIDPELIGGVSVRVGNVVIDGSIRTRLHRLADMLRKG